MRCGRKRKPKFGEGFWFRGAAESCGVEAFICWSKEGPASGG